MPTADELTATAPAKTPEPTQAQTPTADQLTEAPAQAPSADQLTDGVPDKKILYLKDKNMSIEYDSSTPKDQMVNIVRDSIYGKEKMPSVPYWGKRGFIQDTALGLANGVNEAFTGINKTLGLGIFKATRDIFITPYEKESAEAKALNKSENPYRQFANDFSEQLGNMAIFLPVDTMIGGMTKVALAGQILPKIGQYMMAMPDFALGMGIEGLSQGMQEKGAIGGVVEGAERSAYGLLYASVPMGEDVKGILKSVPIMGAIGAADSVYKALKENRLVTAKEIAKGTAEGLAFGSVMGFLPLMEKLTDVDYEKIAINKLNTAITNATKNGDIDIARNALTEFVRDENVGDDTKDAVRCPFANKDIRTYEIGDENPQLRSAIIISDTLQEGEEPTLNRLYTGDSHAEAIEKARQAGENVSNVDIERDGKFITPEGEVLTREEAEKRFGTSHSEEVRQTSETKEEPKTIREKIAAFIDNFKRPEKVKDIEDSFNKAQTRKARLSIDATQLYKSIDYAPDDAIAVRRYNDYLEVFGKEPEHIVLTDKQKELKEILDPISKENQAIQKELTDSGYPTNDENTHNRRFALNRDSFFDKLAAGDDPAFGGSLRRTTGGMKKRVWKCATDEQGHRQIVSIKKGKVRGWTNGKAEDLGNFNMKKYEDLMNKELKPVVTRIENLEKELKILTSTKGRTDAAIQRINNILDELLPLGEQELDIRYKYNPETYNGKVFVDKNGKRWTIGEGTQDEIEAHTNTKYFKDAVMTTIIDNLELKRAKIATDLLDSIKEDPDFSKIAMKAGTQNRPEGWDTVKGVPQFVGYVFEPHVADAIEYWGKRVMGGERSFISAVNNFCRTAIFFNPLIHIPNIGIHWEVNRGLSKWALPQEYATLWKTGSRAIDAVRNFNDDYKKLLDEGVNLKAWKYSGKTLQDLMYDKMTIELSKDQNKLTQLAKDLAMTPKNLIEGLYNWSGKWTWVSNDVATMQAIYEEMDGGKTIQQAIKDVGKHIPNYIVPSRILNSSTLSNIMTNSNITMFGAYHYGMLKSYGEMASSIASGSKAEKMEALDKLAMLAFVQFVQYPIMDKIAQAVTGMKSARVGRAGATTVPDMLYKLAKGRMDYDQAIRAVVTPSILLRVTVEALYNQNTTSKRALVNDDMVEALKTEAMSTIRPAELMSRIASGKTNIKEQLFSLARIQMGKKALIPTTTHPKGESIDMQKDAINQLYKMMENKKFRQKAIESTSKTSKEMKERVADFNAKQIETLKGILKESGLKGKPAESFVKAFLVKESTEKPEAIQKRIAKQQQESSFVKRKYAPKKNIDYDKIMRNF
jgi:hypothetical protein